MYVRSAEAKCFTCKILHTKLFSYFVSVRAHHFGESRSSPSSDLRISQDERDGASPFGFPPPRSPLPLPSHYTSWLIYGTLASPRTRFRARGNNDKRGVRFVLRLRESRVIAGSAASSTSPLRGASSVPQIFAAAKESPSNCTRTIAARLHQVQL